MAFRTLIEYFSGHSSVVEPDEIREQLLIVTERSDLAVAVSPNIDSKNIRGMFLSVDSSNAWVQEYGSDVVVISEDIFWTPTSGNKCWERFIIVKEMMHLFDCELEQCDTGEAFDSLISEFALGRARSKPMESEVKCFWRAMSLLCPETKRLELRTARDNGMENREVADQIKIPEQYVGYLFREDYLDHIEEASEIG